MAPNRTVRMINTMSKDRQRLGLCCMNGFFGGCRSHKLPSPETRSPFWGTAARQTAKRHRAQSLPHPLERECSSLLTAAQRQSATAWLKLVRKSDAVHEGELGPSPSSFYQERGGVDQGDRCSAGSEALRPYFEDRAHDADVRTAAPHPSLAMQNCGCSRRTSTRQLQR